MKKCVLKSFSMFFSLNLLLTGCVTGMDNVPASLNSNYIMSEEIPLGEIDKEETLSDGTKLIYISRRNIGKKYDEYIKQAAEILNKIPFVDEVHDALRSALETLIVCILAGFLLGWYIGDYKTVLAGGIVLSIPKICQVWNLCNRAKKFSFEFGEDKNLRRSFKMNFYKGGRCFTISGSKSKNIGVGGIVQCLSEFAEIDKQYTGDSKYGVVIVVRPKSKLMIEPQGVFQSGVFPARKFNKTELLKCIEKGC